MNGKSHFDTSSQVKAAHHVSGLRKYLRCSYSYSFFVRKFAVAFVIENYVVKIFPTLSFKQC